LEIERRKKPLVFYGTRQVGKTYLLQEFGKTEYRQMVYINFERAEKMRKRLLKAMLFLKNSKVR
jgi:predicted AAA+ superfamily ATPase